MTSDWELWQRARAVLTGMDDLADLVQGVGVGPDISLRAARVKMYRVERHYAARVADTYEDEIRDAVGEDEGG